MIVYQLSAINSDDVTLKDLNHEQFIFNDIILQLSEHKTHSPDLFIS